MIFANRKLVIFHYIEESSKKEMIEVQLYSCNDRPVSADVTLTLNNHKNKKRNQTAGEALLHSKTVRNILSGGLTLVDSRGRIQKLSTGFDLLRDPSNGFLDADGGVGVSVSVNHLRGLTQNIPTHTLVDCMRLINLNICGQNTIISRFKEGKRFGVFPDSKTRSSVVTANTRVHKWATEASNAIVRVQLFNFVFLG